MKILYVAGRWDPKDHNQASGTDYEIYHALEREGAQLEIVGPFNYQFTIFERSLRGLHNRFFASRLFKYPFSYFWQSARKVNQAVRHYDPDLLVSKYSAPMVLTKFKKPLLYVCDSSVKWLTYEWKNKNHAWFTYLTMRIWESKVIRNSTQIVTFSQSNAMALKNLYHVPEERVDYMAIPASIPHQKVPAEIDEKKSLNPVKLLLVGRDYYRKGVDIALEIVESLNQLGVDSTLRIVGLEGKNLNQVWFKGLYDKTKPEQLNEYLDQYWWANFLIHPARFEAAGIVPSEAAAFGVPTITNDTGGLATTVQDGVSGVVLPKGSSAKIYAETINGFVQSPESYHQLVSSTKERYQRELNWPAAGKIIIQLARELVAEQQ